MEKQKQNNKRNEIITKQGCFEQVFKSTGKSFLIKQNDLDYLKNYNLENLIKNIEYDTFIIVCLTDTEYHIGNSNKLLI